MRRSSRSRGGLCRSRKAGIAFIFTVIPSSTPSLTRPGRPVMEPAEVAFPLGEHLVVEAEGGLSCRRCGRAVPLVEANKLAEAPCTANTSHQIQRPPERADTQPPNMTCDACRSRAGVEKTPILDPITQTINPKLLCEDCFKDYLKILRFSGPRFGRGKARALPSSVWYNYGESSSILFTQIGGSWPCPSCDEFYENLYDVVTHFTKRHPEIANKPSEKATVNIDGETVEALKTAQGYLICYCGYTAENERQLAYHVRHHEQY